jgi:hypothetical protein
MNNSNSSERLTYHKIITSNKAVLSLIPCSIASALRKRICILTHTSRSLIEWRQNQFIRMNNFLLPVLPTDNIAPQWLAERHNMLHCSFFVLISRIVNSISSVFSLWPISFLLPFLLMTQCSTKFFGTLFHSSSNWRLHVVFKEKHTRLVVISIAQFTRLIKNGANSILLQIVATYMFKFSQADSISMFSMYACLMRRLNEARTHNFLQNKPYSRFWYDFEDTDLK